MKAVAAVLLVLALGGCAAGGGGFMGTNSYQDAGTQPVNYEQAVKQHLLYSLKDPDSLRDFATGAPQRASCSVGIYGNFHGWRVPVQYNARNSFGGYVGIQRAYYWFHGERLKGVGGNAGFCPEAPAWR